MQTAQSYLEVVRSRGERKLELRRVYRNLQNPELFLLAYGKLYANKGATTPGTDPNDTVDDMSLARIDKIITTLEAGKYRWKPARRIYIPKKNGKLRPLSIPSWEDKLLQEVLRRVLSVYYEPQFSNLSHGFRPERGCHTALHDIRYTWKGTKWFIEGDIKGCFDNIDHLKLLEIMSRNIHDERLMKLLREMLEAGYLEDWKYRSTYSGTPQGGVISPLSANIFLNELDTYVEQVLIPQYTRGIKRKEDPAYTKLQHEAIKAKRRGSIEEYRRLRQMQRRKPVGDPQDPAYRRLRYIRYADDFLLGFIGPKAEAEEIKAKISEFLRGFGLTMSEEKTLLTHATQGHARFLGYEISMAHEDTKLTAGKRSINGTPIFKVPTDVVQAWTKRYTKNGKAYPRAELLENSDFDIVATYGIEFQGLVNYYTMAHDVAKKLAPIRWILEQSLVKTLAAKHKQPVAWVYRNYKHQTEDGRKAITVTVETQGKKAHTARFGGKPIRHEERTIKDTKQCKGPSRNELVKRLLADRCELCGAEGEVSGHHVRKLADIRKRYAGRPKPPAWVQRMMALRRKTLFVCAQCHRKIHAGKYDGPSLK